MINPFKNEDTERHCQDMAKLYIHDPFESNEAHKKWILDNKVVYWEMIAITDRIRYLIKTSQRN